MAKKTPSTEHISGLLTERRKLEQWLNRLDLARDKAKSEVAGKVRQDYERRLREVTEELTQHADGLRQQRDLHARNLAGLTRQETERSEEMSEAELRHAVGEFDEGAWSGVKAGILEKLVKIREGITEEQQALEGLDEVIASLSAAAEAEAEDEDEDEEEEEAAAEPEPVPEPPRGKKKKGKRAEPLDELAFLKSVTEDESGGPSPRRASGAVPAIKDEDVEKDEPDVVTRSRPSVVNQRTLKCAECGALNLPTEWYCEKCGAELAAV